MTPGVGNKIIDIFPSQERMLCPYNFCLSFKNLKSFSWIITNFLDNAPATNWILYAINQIFQSRVTFKALNLHIRILPEVLNPHSISWLSILWASCEYLENHAIFFYLCLNSTEFFTKNAPSDLRGHFFEGWGWMMGYFIWDSSI